MNLSEVSMSELDSIEELPPNNQYSFVRDIDTPLGALLGSKGSQSENLDEDEGSPSASKPSLKEGVLGERVSAVGRRSQEQENIENVRPVDPNFFSSELRRTQQIGERRPAFQFDPAFLEEMSSMQAESVERKKKLEEARKLEQPLESSKVDSASHKYTVATNPYGYSTSIFTDEDGEQLHIATAEHSRKASYISEFSTSPFL